MSTTIEVDSQELWIRSANQELLQQPSWIEIQKILYRYMKTFVDSHLDNEHAREILMELCGSKFKEQYYMNLKHTPHILYEPYMTLEIRRSLMDEFLKKLIDSITSQVKFNQFYDSKEFQAFQNDVSQIYKRYLKNRAQNPVKPPLIKRQSMGCKFVPDVTTAEQYQKRRLGFGSLVCTSKSYEDIGESIAKLLLRIPFQNPEDHGCSFLFSNTLVQQLDQESAHALGKNVKTFDSILNQQTDVDQHRLFAALHGRSIPVSIRRYLWQQHLHNQRLAEECERVMKSNALATLITDPTESAISKLLFRLIQETFRNALKHFSTDQIVKKESDILNQLYVFRNIQANKYVYLLLPILLVFPDIPSRGSAILVQMLNAFILQCSHTGHGSRGELYDASMHIIGMLEHQDNKVYTHLHDVIQTESQMFHQRNPDNRLDNFEIIQNPSELFIKWLEVAFVGCLRPNALFFVWDQCFISRRGWKKELEMFCVDVVILIRKRLLQETTITGIQQQFNQAPLELYTKKLRKRFQVSRTID